MVHIETIETDCTDWDNKTLDELKVDGNTAFRTLDFLRAEVIYTAGINRCVKSDFVSDISEN